MATLTHVSTPATGAVAIFELITLLLAAGWVITRWSDATTYTDATGAPLSANPYGSGGSGAGNLGNTSAWFTVRASDSSREWLFQREANDQTWTISRSKSGFIVGGDATTPSTSTDSTDIYTNAAFFSAPPGRLFVSADDANGYGWRLMVMNTGGGNVRTLIADEPLDAPDPADTDPYLWMGYYDPTGLGLYNSSEQLCTYVYAAGRVYKRFTGVGSNQRVSLLALTAYGSGLGAPPQNVSCGGLPSTFNEVPLPIPVSLVGTPSATTGWCGFTRTLRWATVRDRANGQTLDGAPSYWLYAAGLWLPWDSSTPALA